MFFFFFKQKTAYEMRISDWSSDVCSSDLLLLTGLCLNGGCGLLLLRLGGRDRRQLLAAFGRPVELFDLRILAQIGNRLLDDLVRHHVENLLARFLEGRRRRLAAFLEDRKSTRLNYSH